MDTMASCRLLAWVILLVASGGCCSADGDVDRGSAPAARSPVDLGTWLRTQWQVSLQEARLRGEGGWSSPQPIRRLVKKQLLYTPAGIGYHLQILSNGSVRGVHQHTEYSWVKVFALRPGAVGIQGLQSGLYLCMSSDGTAHGSGRFTDDCLFRETLEENLYSTYASVSHPGLYLALSRHGEVKRRGGMRRKKQPGAHFLPRLRE
ncbi:hypothetical protein GN956_G24371 [Arapaima gigas]